MSACPWGGGRWRSVTAGERTDLKRQAAARPFEHIVRPRETGFGVAALAADGIQEVHRLLAGDEARNALIVEDVVAAASAGRSALVLTERTAHRDLLASLISERTPHVFALSSGIGVKKRAAQAESMAAVPEGEPSVLVATGRLVGEGFDEARLDTPFLAMPISWRGTLQQYAGRLHRLHDEKREVVIYDYVDPLLPVLVRMWAKGLRGYRAMGYRVEATVPPNSGQLQLQLHYLGLVGTTELRRVPIGTNEYQQSPCIWATNRATNLGARRTLASQRARRSARASLDSDDDSLRTK
ncbi:MAG: hypothetical protein JXP37_03485 [Coriobacteriia bacterium]|nr:hypothetical protein [Coriobacteriia bacterium]